jgi:hypothetical protein
MKSELVTIASTIDALTNIYFPACSAAIAMISSVRFPNVALNKPPIASPVFFSDAFGRVAEKGGKWHSR